MMRPPSKIDLIPQFLRTVASIPFDHHGMVLNICDMGVTRCHLPCPTGKTTENWESGIMKVGQINISCGVVLSLVTDH